MTQFAYQRSGGPILSWRRSPPVQSRAADTVALGSLSAPTLVLPRPGAPEPLSGGYLTEPSGGVTAIGDCGCGCKGSGNCGGSALSGVTDFVTTPIGMAAIGLGAYLLYLRSKKRR
jgi:hypothetical protein